MKKGWLKALVASFMIVTIVAVIGSFLTGNTKTIWYESIKPSVTPPNYVFPIAWTILFILIALSLFYSWISARDKKVVAGAFGINLVLNVLWSLFFFYLKNPFMGFVSIILLLLSIIVMIRVSYKIDRKAGLMLVPYLLWVGFATVLNYLVLIR